MGSAADDKEQPDSAALRGANVLDARLDAVHQRYIQRQAQLRSPEAAEARRRSRTLFGDLSQDEALELGRQAFASELGGGVWNGIGDLPHGQTVDRFLGDFAARIHRPGKSKAIVESTVPLRVEDARGRKAPVDLALQDGGEFFESKHAIVPVRFHKDLSRGVTLAEAGVGVMLEGIDPEAAGEVRSDRLAVADALVDTDYWAAPIPGGFETFAVLRSPESPERIAFDVDLPQGAELRPSGDGATVVGSEGPVASISAPAAHDADGEPVAIDMSVDGSRLVIDIVHRGQDLRYPILVDPKIEGWNWYGYLDTAPNGFVGYTNAPNTFDWFYADLPHRYDAALYIATRSGSLVSVGNYGGWVFNPQGPASYVYRAEMEASTNALSACIYRGINDGYDVKTNCSSTWHNGTTSCVVSTCDPNAGGNDNYAYFQLQSTTTSVRSDATKAVAALGSAKMYYSDRDVPSFGGLNSGGTGTAWAQSYSGQVTGAITDGSLGMGEAEVIVAGAVIDGNANACQGYAFDPCPHSLGTGFWVESDAPPLDGVGGEGKHSIAVVARDTLGQQSSTTWGNFWIDRSGPSLALSGSLWDGRVVTEPGTALMESSDHNLHIVATDGVQGGTAAERRSGVKSVEVRVDGELVLAPNDVSCPPATTDSCPSTRNYAFSTGEFSAGRHTVTVTAKDQIGNLTVESFDVIVPGAGELLLPKNDSSTSRWVRFEAHADNPSFTTVKFQYRRPLTGWQDVPQSAMVDAQGQPVTTIDHPLASGDSPVINWDVPVTWALLGAEPGPLDVRARFSDGSGPGGSSKPVRVTFDPSGLGTPNSRTGIGPGTVDLLTGNFSYRATDAILATGAERLSVARSFNSRDPQANPGGPFGPGWVTSVPVSGISDFANVREISDAVNGDYIELALSDGGKIYFIPKPGGGYESAAGAEALTLTKPASDRFQLNDGAGNVSVFEHQAGTPVNQYDLTEVIAPGTGNAGTVIYDASGRIFRILAPPPPGVDCTSTADSVNSRGCRSLTFFYATTTTATGTEESEWGNYVGRVKQIDFKGWDGGGWQNGFQFATRAIYRYDSTGKLRATWDHTASVSSKVVYNYDVGGRLSQIVRNSEPAWTLSYQQLAGDADGGRLRSASRETPQGTATSTVVYDVPVSGIAAPYQLGASDVAEWSQEDHATSATAVFPPDQVPADPPTTYSRATIHYMNRSGLEVNTVAPGGAVSTSEYDRHNNVIRELSPTNRARALASGSLSVEVSERLDVQRTYEDSGLELVEELGPEHEVKLEDTGATVQARARNQIVYDEGAPEGNPHLPTTTTTSAQVAGGPASADVRVSKTEYDWTLRKPTKTITDHGGLNQVSDITYDSDGRVLTSTMPKAGSGVRTNVYYTAGGSGTCGARPEWHGLLCQAYVAASGLPAELPEPRIKTYTYDEMLNVLTEVQKADGEQIMTTKTYTPDGKPASVQTVGNGIGSGLVAAYGFEELSGTTAVDSSANGNDGVLENGAARVDGGRVGRGIRFDGVDDLVRVADSPSLDLDGFTIEAWIKQEDSVGPRSVVSRGSSVSGCTGPGYGLRVYGAQVQGASCGSWRGGDAAAGNLWKHVAVTRSGTTLTIYENGDLTYSGTVSSQTDDTADLLIGAALGGANFSGVVDEVRVYNRALSETEIETDMHRPVVDGSSHAPMAQPSGLVTAYGFEEKPGSTVITDSSGNGNDGDLDTSVRVAGGHHGAALLAYGNSGDDYISIPDAFTAEAWVALDPDTTYYSWMPIHILSSGHFAVYYSEWYGLNVDLYTTGGYYALNAPVTLGTDASHIAVAYDGVTLELYVDGALEQSLFVDQQPDTGYDGIGFGDGFSPIVMDEIKVFDHARSAGQIQADAATPIADPHTSTGDGHPVSTSYVVYDAATGLPVEERMAGETTMLSTVTEYDSLGRTVSYTDSSGNTTTTDYDLLGRPTEIDDGKGTQSYSYDSVTGDLVQLEDSHAGTFTATYGTEGELLSQTYPNGMTADVTYDEAGDAVSLAYTKTTNCSSNCVWYAEEVQSSIHGRWLTRDSTLSDQEYSYDGVGRLILTKDTDAAADCTTRTYAYDGNSNRTGLTIRAAGAGGACDTTSAGQVQSSTYDALDRLTNPGVVYDTWGRIARLPASHAGGGDLETTYYVNDMVRSQAQGAVSKGWLLDPLQTRYRATIPAGTTQEVMHYSNDSDSPAWTEILEDGVPQSWERSVIGIDGSLAAIVSNDGGSTSTELQLTDLHGDVIATADPDLQASALLETFETDEFGNPKQSGDRKFGYLGGKQRRAVLDSGVIQMGVRSYVPAMGRFTSVDPITGGSANDYDYANQDPVNQFDLDGRLSQHSLMAWGESFRDFFHDAFKGATGPDPAGNSVAGCVDGALTGIIKSQTTGKLANRVSSKFTRFLLRGSPLTGCMSGAAKKTAMSTDWYKAAVKYSKSYRGRCAWAQTTATCWVEKKQKGGQTKKIRIKYYYDDPFRCTAKICG